ncbi:hypothetical protein [Microcella flavibacter]|uniref:hypothetical protein n=1 Tax=Microcella flavibacter TaxID=1804990 RepID=UPI001E2E7211|nr:hypothetical protein [Microcella flavibacter]
MTRIIVPAISAVEAHMLAHRPMPSIAQASPHIVQACSHAAQASIARCIRSMSISAMAGMVLIISVIIIGRDLSSSGCPLTASGRRDRGASSCPARYAHRAARGGNVERRLRS